MLLALLLPAPQGVTTFVRETAAPPGGIAFDATTVVASSATSQTACNFTHTPVGTPTLVLVWIGMKASRTISVATYGGQAMSLVAVSGSASAAGDEKMHLYEKHSPLGGAQTVNVEFTLDNHYTCIAQSFTGTHASDATVEDDGYDNSGGTCAAATTTLTMNATSSWMVTASVWHGADALPIAETGFTARGEGETGGGETSNDDAYNYGDSTGDTGSLSHISDAAVTDECGQVSVELIPAA